MTDSDLLWAPRHPERAQSTVFRKHIAGVHGVKLDTYEDLLNWSFENRGEFWSEVWDWEGVIGDKGEGPYVDEKASPRDNPTWFPNARLNWAENMLRNYHTHPDDIALIDVTEHCPGFEPKPRPVTQRELYNLVGQAEAAFRKAGVEKGHRVAYWGGNRLEAVVTLLATTAIGAIFSSAAADFGVEGVIERLQQIKPRLLVVSNGVVYNGKAHALLPLLPKLFSSLQHPPRSTFIIEHVNPTINPLLSVDDFLAGNHDGYTKLAAWSSFIDPTGFVVPTFERMGFNAPIWILFSSGTTGKPKAIVHRAGGMLIDSLREHHLQGDITRGDIFFYYTTPGWMMFQYLVSGLATGATIVLYDGSPLKDPASMWKLIDDLDITHFGTSAKYIEMVSKVYPDVKDKHKLKHLKQIMSTGSPLAPGLFDFVYSNIKKDVLLGSVSGGTDICSVFAGRCTSLPVYRGEIQARMLGFALGSTATTPGETGELMCSKAFPIEPVGFWPLAKDTLPDGADILQSDVDAAQERFLDSYFKGNEGYWYHGDFIRMTPSRSGNGGGFVMLGRSDGVLNPGGIRFGPTDIYSVLENPAFAARGVDETLVVGLLVEDGSDEKVCLFVKMRDGYKLDDELLKAIKTSIRAARSARHVPSHIIQVTDVPMTLTGKKIEVPIRKVINGADPKAINPSTLRNPECLEQYVTLGADLRAKEGVTVPVI